MVQTDAIYDVRTHLAFRTGYSIHRTCFLFEKERVTARLPISDRVSTYCFYLHGENSSISILLFPESISLSRGQKSALGRLPPLETHTRACFISGPARPSYDTVDSRISHFHRSSNLFQFSFFHALNFLHSFAT